MNRPFVHQEVTPTIRAIQAVGITAAAFLAGQQASLTYISTPALLESPAPLLAKQWKKIFDVSAGVEGATSLLLGGLFSYLAYREPSTASSSFKLYTTAAVLLPAAIPYTILLMKPINSKLLSKADSLASTAITDTAAESGVDEAETTHALVDKWATLSLGRALLAAVGAGTAAWATISSIDVLPIRGLGLASGADRM
jgi:hypothetical protein